jgi:hypothetical protein
MTRDTVQRKRGVKKDEKWTVFIEQANAEIKRLQRRIYALRKSLIFFNKQAEEGIPFPSQMEHRHKEIS